MCQSEPQIRGDCGIATTPQASRLLHHQVGLVSPLPALATAMIPKVVALQDNLGDMRDAAVTVEEIDELLARRKDPSRLIGILAYREPFPDTRTVEYTVPDPLRSSFPVFWPGICLNGSPLASLAL